MRVAWLGHSCFWLADHRGVRVVIDPYPDPLGLPFPFVEADVVAVTHDHFDHNAVHQVGGEPLVVRGPRPARAREIVFRFHPTLHDDAGGLKCGSNQVLAFELDGLAVCHLGDLGHLLAPELAARLARPDLLFVPVGGASTLDAAAAGKVVAQLEPRVVVPMHFHEPGLRMKLDPLDGFLIGRACLTLPELVLEPGHLPPARTVVVLERRAPVPEAAG